MAKGMTIDPSKQSEKRPFEAASPSRQFTERQSVETHSLSHLRSPKTSKSRRKKKKAEIPLPFNSIRYIAMKLKEMNGTD